MKTAYLVFSKLLLLRTSLLTVIILFGLISTAQNNVAFSPSTLKNVDIASPTSIQFGPDGKLYVSQQNGIIKIFTIARNGSNDYTVLATEVINLINLTPNHNDDGSLAPSVVERQVTSILVRGTAAQPVLYVTSSDSRAGGPGGDSNLDTNSGIVSLLTKPNGVWQKIDLVRGIPRSEENHANSGVQLDEQHNMMYIAVGGFTNGGAPSFNFAYISEYALAAAIVSIDLNVINALPTKGTGNNSYKYDLPTLDDPTRANNPDGSDVNDPFGGNNGLNQSKIVVGGPVQVYAAGFRNSYDLLITKSPGKSGRMYTIDNGGNQGWGGYPDNEGGGNATNKYLPAEPGSTGPGVNDPLINNLDNLHYIGNIATYVPGTYYGGHPNPIRANPAGAGLNVYNGATGASVWRTSKTGSNPLPSDWPPVPLNMAHPVEGDFQNPGETDNAILTFSASTNGLAEYTASNFNNTLKGTILACSYDGKIVRITPTEDGTNVTNLKSSTNKLNKELPVASGFGAEPLDITCQGDSDIYPGTFWVVSYGSQRITVFEPQDFINCTGLYNNMDDDEDGYTNADEIDNGTQPCSAASKPNDYDKDNISDLNDPDDDNDGIPDNIDYFPLDPNNGLTTSMPIIYNLFNNDPGTGLFGMGLTGLMSNKKTDNDYLKVFDEDNMIAGGAVGAISLIAVTPGDALGTLNNQENGFQFGMKKEAGTGPFTVTSRMVGHFFNDSIPKGAQSQGIYVGTGDQSNYLKVALNANGGAGGIEVIYENADVPVSFQFPIAGGIPAVTLDLLLSVNPVNGTIQPKYSANGGAIVNLGSPIAVTGPLLTALQSPATALAVGLISTSRGGNPFTATWDWVYVTTDSLTSNGSWQTIAPLSGAPIAREENAYVKAGDRFYLMGGRNIDSVQAYNPIAKSWTGKAKPPMELNHFQAVTMDGLIYVAGAFTGTYPRETPVPQLYVYNPLTDKWLNGSTIPAARRRGAAGTVSYKNKIYLVGGITDGHWTGSVSWFDEYDPSTNTWKTLPDAPRVRDHFQAAVINDKLYVAGGRRTSGVTGEFYSLTIPQVDVYNFTTGIWSTLPAANNIPTPRAGASTAVLGNEIIIAGGESTLAAANAETEALNVQTNTWRKLSNMQKGRHATQVIESNNGLYTVAGGGNQGGGSSLISQEAFYMFAPTVPDVTPLAQSPLSAPSGINFGSVPLNGDSSSIVTLNNTGGSQAILVTSITLTGASSFSDSIPVSLPFVIPVGKSINLKVKFSPTTANLQTSSLVVSHSGQGGTLTIGLNGDGSAPLYRINSGGGKITNSIGTFDADNYYSGNTTTYSTSTPITGTTDGAIYQTERNGVDNEIHYAFPVTNGQYMVILHFAEIYLTAPNNRLFDVSAEGLKVLDNYDIFKKAGANTATTEKFPVNVLDGTLNVDFSSLPQDGGSNRAKVSAIEILRISTNQAPVANAGADRSMNSPASSITLAGSGVDADGSISLYSWSQVSGPNTAVFSSNSVASPNITGLVIGNYVFSLVVTDNQMAPSLADQVIVTVNAAGIVPVYRINAGGGQVTNSIGVFAADAYYNTSNTTDIYTTTADIVGTSNDEIYKSERSGVNGVLNYDFPVPNGKYTVVLHFAEIYYTATGSRVFDVSIEGNKVLDNYDIYNRTLENTAITETFTTTVTDGILNIYLSSLPSDGGANRPKIAAIEILKVSNQLPIANAGPDKTISLPLTSTTLAGSGTDADGTVGSYAWTQVSGPNTAIFSSKTVAVPTVSGLAIGSYVFSLVVTDNDLGVSGADQVIITVNSGVVNQVPVANAGPDKTITLPTNSTTLSGSGTDVDGTISTYAWTQMSGPNTAIFSSNTSATPTISGLIAGSYIFSLVVTDNQSAASIADQIILTVNPLPGNILPVANAGPDGAITLPNSSTTLNGSGTDADGTISLYSWTQISGPNTAVFSSKSVPSPVVNGLIAGAYMFSLVVTDNQLAVSTADQVIITVNSAPVNLIPVANAGPDKSITLPVNSTSLNGAGTDADGSISAFTWTQVSGPVNAAFSSKSVAVPTVSALIAGVYKFSLVVTDDKLALSLPDTVIVTVNSATANQPPVADAGPDKVITQPVSSATLNGLGSDPDGSISAYSWTQVSGPNAASFSSVTIASPTVTGLIPGIYVFSLVVIDNQLASSVADQVMITVNAAAGNLSPVANAGPDKSITLPVTSVSLSGSGSDADGTISNYSWSQVSGPNTATFSSKAVAVPTVSGLAVGIYVFSLTVTDNQLATSTADQVVVTVISDNQVPVADAGPDKAITLPVSSVILNGVGTDPDGTISVYTWSQVSGPNTAVFSSKNVAAPTVSGLAAGSYVFSLIVTDNQQAISVADQVVVTVNAVNIIPVANAGPDKSISLPVTGATLNGSGTDVDGTISEYVWSQVTGPNTATFSSKTVAVPTVSGLIAGSYAFILIVTDNQLAKSLADTVLVTVGTTNQTPVANAGPDKTVTLPITTTTLSGSGTDVDGTISSYSWSQFSGPNTATFSSKLVAVPTISGLAAGSYLFTLIVTDNQSAVSLADTVLVTVSALNQIPIANAGPDKTVTLPITTTTLSGSGTDVDGTISSYSWSQFSGPNTATFSSKLVAVPTISGLAAGNYVFTLIVTDNQSAVSLADTVLVTVSALNQIPIANAGPDKTVTLPATTTTLSGSGIDVDGTIASYSWSQFSGPNTATFSNKLVAVPTISGLAAGSYVFTLIVTDNQSAVSLADTVLVTVSALNQIPIANAGPDKTVTLPATTTTLSGSGIDVDGTIASYSWSQFSGPNTATFSSKLVAVPTISGLAAGNYVFTLIVTDNQSAVSLADTVLVTVSALNQIPIANAGPDKTVTLPTTTTTLSGSGIDVDGRISSYSWSQFSGPNTATFSSKLVAVPTISGLAAGNYVFTLIVTDNQSAVSLADTVLVTVSALNQIPIANAGPDKTVTLPTTTTTLSGSGIDVDGTISSYSWSQFSGPNTATFSSKLVAVPTISGLAAGSYLFTLIVTDNQSALSLADTVLVTVSALNQIPIANAGPDKTVTLPTTATTLSGSGIDVDGTISSYSWSQFSGPNTATFSSKLVAVPTISGLAAGSYVFTLIVTDNQSAVSLADTVLVTVSAANQIPVANAGPDKSIVLPVSSTTLDGSGTDANGTVTAFTWTQISGPNTATFSNKLVAVPTVSGLTTGSYAFSLVVTDNQLALSLADTVIVNVAAAPVSTPVYRINAGGGQVTNSIGVFAADNYFSPTPGYTSSTSADIIGTTYDAIYQTERFGLDGTLNYAFPVSSGQYTVILHFAEIYYNLPNIRVFDVSLEGTKVLDNYDIFKKVGFNTPTKETFSVNVTDGVLNIYFSSLAADGGSNSPKVSAIEIIRTSGNATPVADAGPDKTIILPTTSTRLNGAGTDADGTITAYTWTQVSGPNTATFSSKTVAVPTISGLVAGNYVFSLVVTDNQFTSSAADQVLVTVSSTASVPVFRINAGGGQVTNSIGVFAADNYFSPTPGNTSSTNADIIGTTDDAIYQTERFGLAGTLNYAFPVTSGQYMVILHFAEIYYNAANIRVFDVSLEGNRVLDNYDIFKKVGFNTPTTETFSVNVTDGTLNIYFSSLAADGGSNSPKVSAIEIIRTSGNASPVADAGPDKTIVLPVTTTTLNGSGTDADGTISAYTWTQVSGPNLAVFNSKSIAVPAISGLIAGTYIFSLTVTDNQSAVSAADQVIVTVNSTASTPVYRINAGGGQVTNSIGVFAADNYYSPTPGNTSSTTADIIGTTDDAIYQTERFGLAGTLNYAFPVTNGQYTVVLHFAEIYYNLPNIRIFDVSLEGTRVLDNYDIFKKVGFNTATTETFNVNVTDGTLNIYFSSLAADGGSNSPKVSAIEIIKTSSVQTVATEAGIANSINTTNASSGSDSEPKLRVKVRPNPTTTFFTLDITGGNAKTIFLRIFSADGKLVESRSNIGNNSTLHVGHKYIPGLYYAEVLQGKQRVALKFVKLKD